MTTDSVTQLIQPVMNESSRIKKVIRPLKYTSVKKISFTKRIRKGLSARAAAIKLKINVRTAQKKLKKDQEEPDDQIREREVGCGRPVGRSSNLGKSMKHLWST